MNTNADLNFIIFCFFLKLHNFCERFILVHCPSLVIILHKHAFTGEATPELLEAEHIQPYIDYSSNHVQNGLYLRVDLHRLFDNGLLAIDENFRIRLSGLLKESDYWKLNGMKITLPLNAPNHPSIDALRVKLSELRV